MDKTVDDGGPAFPWGEHGTVLGGMTIRDYFAIHCDQPGEQVLYVGDYSEQASLEAMRMVRVELLEEAAKVAGEFNRPGDRAPTDLGDDNGIWNNCATRISCCIRALIPKDQT